LALRAESAHEEGRKGVFRTKRWLESTTHIELNFDAYEWASECTVNCLGGAKQTFDLKGQIYETKSVLPIRLTPSDGGTAGWTAPDGRRSRERSQPLRLERQRDTAELRRYPSSRTSV
jgi:hypothetical protein